MWTGFWERLVEPSPKLQNQDVSALLALSLFGQLNCTLKGTPPVVGLAVN